MNKLGKILTYVFLLVMIASTLTVVTSASAQSTPKPSVPQFTVQLIAHPYDVPPKTTTTIDQYTGKESTYTQPGYHVENRSIEVTIINPHFIPYNGSDGYEYILLFNVHVKGHFGDRWNEFASEIFPSDSQYTVVTGSADYPEGSQVDFQVEAVVGYVYDALAGRPIQPLYQFMPVERSGWSSTQTITIGETTPTATITPTMSPTTIAPTPTNTPTPSYSATATPMPTAQSSINSDTNSAIPQLSWLEIGAFTVLGIVVAVLVVFLVLMRMRNRGLELKQNGV